MRRPSYDMNIFKERRQSLAHRMKGGALIIRSNPDYIRNNDVHHSYRQDTNMFYLSGFEEPESIFVFRPGQSPETVLFVRPKDVLRETWDGFRYGPEGAEREYKIDKAYLLEDFDKVIIDLLKPVDKVYYRWHIDREFDKKVLNVLSDLRLSQGRTGRGYLPILDSAELIGELRVVKSLYDVTMMRKACEISANAHVEAMRFTRPGVTERQVQGVLIGSFLMQNADREGYGTIVASGANATTLHYVFNDQPCRDGDLLLIDAGAEYRYYTGDITRTFPVNGKFTSAQKKVYDRVLDLQKDIISKVKPGIEFKSMQDATIDFLTDVMIELKLLQGTRAQNVESGAYRKYYPHGVGHWLGMDVHDAGLSIVGGESRRLEIGMAFTVEPGLYIPIDDMSAPAELRGIGIRIEDNIVVTPTGAEVLTSGVPKETAEMEAIIGKSKS